MGSKTQSRCLIHESVSFAKGSCPSSMVGRNGTMISGTVAWSSSGADLGFVTSAITNRDSPASSLTVSVKVLRLRLFEVEDDRQVSSRHAFQAAPFQELSYVIVVRHASPA